MWQATVRVDRAAAVVATPEQAWSLLSSPRAWSVRPRPCLVFELAAGSAGGTADAGRWFYLAGASGVAVVAVLDVSVSVPGQILSVQTPGGLTQWELSVGSGRRGTALRIRTARLVSRPAKIDTEIEIRADLDGWLAALADIAAGRRPWPADGIPESLRQACLAAPPWQTSVEASATVQIDASPEHVARAVGALDVLRSVQTLPVLSSGYIPGTPAGQVGGIRYFTYRLADGTLGAVASLIAASSPTAMMTRQVTAPFSELTYGWSPEDGGRATRLEISRRLPAPAAPMSPEQHEAFQAAVTAMAARYKVAVEDWRPAR